MWHALLQSCFLNFQSNVCLVLGYYLNLLRRDIHCFPFRCENVWTVKNPKNNKDAYAVFEVVFRGICPEKRDNKICAACVLAFSYPWKNVLQHKHICKINYFNLVNSRREAFDILLLHGKRSQPIPRCNFGSYMHLCASLFAGEKL